ncbi:MAG: disulfide oxidoreductase [Actinomycetota bacterium]
MPDFQTATTFLALLTLFAAASALALGGLRVAAALGAPRGWQAVSDAVGPSALLLAWLVALTSTLGSLYYSEVVGLVPCVLCWYQRIAMYPLVVLLGIAALRGDPGVRRYALPLAAIGAAIALGHYALEWAPVEQTAACDAEAPCGVPSFREFGFVSIPFMALSGFALVATLLLTPAREER